MIQHKENGLLVANQDVEKLSEAMVFVEDENLYRYCKQMRYKKRAIFFGFQQKSSMVGFNEYQLKIEL
jgi:hypothetical protein